MNINNMDDILKEINQIHNIQVIKYVDLSSINSDKYTIIPSFLVIYDGLKSIHLSSMDKYFNEFVAKLREVYISEADNVVEIDMLGRRKYIKIDELSKKLLLDENIDKIDDLYSFYKDKYGYSERLINFSDDVNTILPIIKYHLKDTLSLFNKTINFDGNLCGYNNTFYLSSILDGLKALIPFNVVKNNNEYYIEIGGLFDRVIPCIMNIKFTSNSIFVNATINEFDFSNSYNYESFKQGIKMTEYALLNDKLIVINNNMLDNTNCEYTNIANIGYEDTLDWYKLPWDAFFGIKRNEELLGESEKIIEERNIYLDVHDNYFINREYTTKRYKKDSTVLVDTKEVLLDKVDITTLGIKKDDILIIETCFNNGGVNGFYKTYLSGRYFYHLSNLNSFNDLDSKTLISISKDDNIINKGDLLRKNKLNKIIRRSR